MNSGINTKNYLHPLSQWEWNIYSIPIAITIILFSNAGYNGLNGDFGLDYCVDGDQTISYSGTNENYEGEAMGLVEIDKNSFFACEIGYIEGYVELGYSFREFSVDKSGTVGIEQVIILNHENYRHFVKGENYGFSNFGLSLLSMSSSDYPSGIFGEFEYHESITLHADTYFFVVVTGEEWRGTSMPSSPKHQEYPEELINKYHFSEFDFAYNINIDYLDSD
jgi:hypothetical protein